MFGFVRRSQYMARWSRDVASGELDPRDSNSIVIDGPSGKALYVPIPKAANTSIRTALLPCFTDKPDYTINIHHHPDLPRRSLRESCAEMNEMRLAFTVVRHPAERILSTFRNKIGRGKYFGHAVRLGISRTASFDQFLDVLLQVPPAALDSHFKPQTLLLDYVLDHPDLRIYKTEDIASQWPDIAGQISEATGRSPASELGHLNTSGSRDDSRTWTRGQRNAIMHLFRHDFERFDYDW